MINVVYLVLVFYGSGYDAGGAIAIPQANMKQCQVNAKNYRNVPSVKVPYCIVGVK